MADLRKENAQKRIFAGREERNLAEMGLAHPLKEMCACACVRGVRVESPA